MFHFFYILIYFRRLLENGSFIDMHKDTILTKDEMVTIYLENLEEKTIGGQQKKNEENNLASFLKEISFLKSHAPDLRMKKAVTTEHPASNIWNISTPNSTTTTQITSNVENIQGHQKQNEENNMASFLKKINFLKSHAPDLTIKEVLTTENPASNVWDISTPNSIIAIQNTSDLEETVEKNRSQYLFLKDIYYPMWSANYKMYSYLDDNPSLIKNARKINLIYLSLMRMNNEIFLKSLEKDG